MEAKKREAFSRAKIIWKINVGKTWRWGRACDDDNVSSALEMCHETLEKKDQSTLTFIVANFPPFLSELDFVGGTRLVGKGRNWKSLPFSRESALDFATADFSRKSRSRVSRAATSFYFPGCMCSPSLRSCAPPWKSCQANKESLDLFASLSLLETWSKSYLIPSCATSTPFLPLEINEKSVLIEKKSLIYLEKIHLTFKKFTYK